MQNEMLAMAYDEVNPDKAKRLRACGSSLTFRRYEDGTLKLDSMNSCRVRLCPMCQWRRSLRNFYNNNAIADYVMQQPKGGAWLALTLTVRNCIGEELRQTIDHMFYAFDKMIKQKNIKAIVRGFYRGLEVTHDCREFITDEDFKRRKSYLMKQGLSVGDRNPTFDLFHPHFHVLFFVNKSYFDDGRKYLSVEKWAKIWQKALDVDYMPSIKIQRVKALDGDLSGAIAEISKYSTKSTDYIYPDDWDLTVKSVRVLDAALSDRRLIGYGGELREAKRILKLADADSGDLVNVGEADEKSGENFQLVSYFWNTGYRQYVER